MTKRHVALLRGINVGGRNKLSMDELTSILKRLGLEDVSTYIQSGNVVFSAVDVDERALAARVSEAIAEEKGFSPEVLIMPMEKLEAAAAANPFPEAEGEPGKLHLAFAETIPPDPDLNRLESLRSDPERFELIGDVLYLHAPNGIGRSKLAAGIEKSLGVPTTMRNWRTVTKVLGMA